MTWLREQLLYLLRGCAVTSGQGIDQQTLNNLPPPPPPSPGIPGTFDHFPCQLLSAWRNTCTCQLLIHAIQCLGWIHQADQGETCFSGRLAHQKRSPQTLQCFRRHVTCRKFDWMWVNQFSKSVFQNLEQFVLWEGHFIIKFAARVGHFCV